MAEKMPEKYRWDYEEETKFFMFWKKDIQNNGEDCIASFNYETGDWITQDLLDLLLSLLPEPRRALLELELDDDDIPHHLNGILLDDKFTWIDTYYLTNTLDKKEALAETVIYETFKQLKEK